MSAPQRSRAVDVAVVGGGIIGLSAAWRLAQQGLDVALFERGELGCGASRVAAGMLGPTVEAEYGPAGRRGLELGLQALERWPAFADELALAAGIDVGLRCIGTLVLACDRDEAEALDREIAFRQSLGLHARRLLGSEARAVEPAIAPSIRLALHAPDDHCVDPRLVVAALARAAADAGAELRTGTPVERLCIDGDSARDGADRPQRVRSPGDTGEGAAARAGRVTGLRLTDGSEVAAACVVVAAGAWSGRPGLLAADATVPVRPVKGQTLRLRDPQGPGLLCHVVRFDGGYLVPRLDGRYVLGATMEERGFDTSATAGAVYELLRAAREVLPAVSELEIEELAVGLRPGSPDNLPLVGAAAQPGLVWATGHHRNGILLAPLTADLVAAAVTGGDVGQDEMLAGSCDATRFQAAVGTLA